MLLLLTFACQSQGGGGADYDLTLTPVFPQNQAPFDLVQSLRLTLVEDGEEVGEGRIDTVPGSGESASANAMPALDNTEIYLEALGQSEVVSWGKTAPITATTGDVEAAVYVAKAEMFGYLGGLETALSDTMPISVGNGVFYAAGGTTLSPNGTSLRGDDGLYMLDIPNSAAIPTFTRVGDLPVWSDDDKYTERSGASFLYIEEPGTGTPYAILAGGGFTPVENGGGVIQSTYSVNLYNLETGVWDETPLDNRDQLQSPRQDHVATVDYRGQVVVAGGWIGDGGGWLPAETVEMYVPNERKFYTVGTAPNDLGSMGLGIASLGEKGTLLCGGGVYASDGRTWSASSACVRVATSREFVSDVKAMEVAVVDAAMVTLPDGRVLSIGGGIASGDQEYGEFGAIASQVVQEYDPLTDTWVQHPGALNLARIGARAVAVGDDKVLVFGGASTWDPLYGAEGALACAELVDTTGFTSESLTACNADSESGDLPSAVFEPGMAVDPEFGVIALGGRTAASGDEGIPASTAALYLYPRQP